MNKLKELRLIVKMNEKLGVQTEQSIYDQIAAEQLKEDRQLAMQEERKNAFKSLFTDLAKDINKLVAEDKKKTEEEQALLDRFTNVLEHIESIKPESDDRQVTITEEVVEDQQFDELVEKSAILAPPETSTLAAAAAKRLTDTTAPSMFIQPEPAATGRDIQAIQNKLKLLEGWVSKISMAGPGGGEVLFRYLDDVNRGTMNTTNDNWVLEYDAATKKVQFTEDIGPIKTTRYNTIGPDVSLVAGQVAWNPDEDCLDIHHADGSTLQTGLEHYIRVRNESGNTMPNGTVVRFAGVYEANAHEPIVVPHIANGTVHGLYTVGVLTNDLPNNTTGRATWNGKVHDMDTTGSSVGEVWVKGDLLYVHPTMAGKLTKVKPYAPNIVVSIAAVLHVGSGDGILLVRPTIYPRLYYGTFLDVLSQTAAVINTPYAVKMRTPDISNGHHIINETRIVAEASGFYDYKFSLQVTSQTASKKEIYIWARKNGADIPNTASRLTITGNEEYKVPSWNFQVSMNTNDYFELMWAVSDLGAFITAPAATAFCPAIPSVIMTVSQIAL